MIVVTAPTGQIGQHVVQQLLAAGAPLRLIARDATKLSDDVRSRVEVIEGSHGDAAIVQRAFEGADAVFWLAPPDPQRTLEEVYIDFTRPAAAAFRKFGVKRVVGITALGRGTQWHDRAGLVTASIRMDDLIMQSGVAFRGLAMPSFMDNFSRQTATITGEGIIYGQTDAEKKAPMTATRDMGAVAARLLADDSWTGQEESPVIGPEDLSMNEVAAIIAQVLGRDVHYRQVPFDAFKTRLLGYGSTESFAQGYVDMMRAKNEGMDNVAERTVNTRTPTTFQEWCEQELKPLVPAR